MKRQATVILLIIALCVSTAIYAAQPSPISIVEHIRAGRIHTVNIPDSVAKLLEPGNLPADSDDESADDAAEERLPSVVNGKVVGYRIQVFSDNNARTAKNAVRSKQRMVSSRFPAYRAYVSFNSPYWRLKVGDFRTQQEANKAAEELKRAFPASAKEIRVVRDRINVAK